MEKTLLYEAFSTLTPVELREFGKFVRSPFFNTKQQVVALYEYLLQCREKGVAPEKEGAWVAINPTPDPSPDGRGDAIQNPSGNAPPFSSNKAKGAWAAVKPFPDGRGDSTRNASGSPSPLPSEEGSGVGLRLANSALLALLEHFWMYREKFEDEGRAKIRLAAAYRKRNLAKHFQITQREARQSRERLPWRHAGYYHDLNLLEWEQYRFDSTVHRNQPLNLQAVSDLMDTAFIARKLQLACLALSHQAVFSTDYHIGLLAPVLAHVEARQLNATPAIGLYYNCYRFLTDARPDAYFDVFRDMLIRHAALFPEEELRALYLLAINFGVKKINESARGWLSATLDLYKGALERDLLLENGLLSRFAFNNIAAIALRTGELDWAEQFVLQYKPRLERHWREATAGLNLARIAYARRDFKTALLNLQRSDYKDLINNLIAKTLQLKIYYETAEFDLLDSHLASMKNFIRRHTATGHYRTNYSRMVRYTQQLMALDFNDAKAVAGLRAQIEKEEILTEKDWLLDMLDG
ncbi:MAG: hypothetical protein IPK76_22150 [Lewinellaceae bacterium]|nr:hypothetical protein [Lewinellaceae bacterium]